MEFDPTDAGAREAAEQAEASRRHRETRLAAEDFKWLMSDKRGRRIVFRWLERTGVFQSSFTGDAETFFREGQRNVGLQLLAQVNDLTPQLYPTMLKEQREHE